MTNALPLILSQTSIQRGFKAEPTCAPSVAAVYATGAGELTFFGGRTLPFGKRLLTECRTRYDVDMSDHRHRAELASRALRTRDGHFFIARVDVGFRVHDPCEVVRRNIRDALPVVYTYLGRAFEALTLRFDVEDPSAAEHAIHADFANPVALPDGITIFEVIVRLRPDDATAKYLLNRQSMQRAYAAEADQHRVEVQRQRQRAELDGLNHQDRLGQQKLERVAMLGQGLSAADMAREHLVRHPEDTETVMRMLLEHEQAMLQAQDVHNQRATEFIKFMMDNDVIPPGNFQPFVEGAARAYGLPTTASALSAPGANTWNQAPVLAVPGASAPTTSGNDGKPEQITLEQDPATKIWMPSDGVQPVYLLVDESAGAAPYLDDLGEGLRRLLDGLRKAPDIAPAVRLCVLGYADQTATRLPLVAVDAGTSVPWLTTRGPASYANAFETLYSRITPDIDALKAQNMAVRRPLVFLLAATAPADDGIWDTPYARLTDPQTHRYAPHILACGVGDARQETIAAIATKDEFGYVATANVDIHRNLDDYWEALTHCLLAYGRTLLAGAPELEFELPPHFRMAATS